MGKDFENQVGRALCDRTQVWRPHIRYPTLVITEKFSGYLTKVIEGGMLSYRPFHLGVAAFAYNTTKHLYLRQTPFEVGWGHPPVMPSTFEASDDFGGDDLIRTQETVKRFLGLREYVQLMLELEGENIHSPPGVGA